MNYCKSSSVAHNAATGFLNQADRLIIVLLGQRGQEFTIPDLGGQIITQPSLVLSVCSQCSAITAFPNPSQDTLRHSQQ